MSAPTLLCFTGPPGAGKSVLARAVSQQLELPLFDRDDFKDIMFDALGWSDREWSRRVGKASWAMIYAVTSTLVARRVTTLLDSNFRPSDLIVERLTELTRQHGVGRLEVHLSADAEVLYGRYRSRFLAGGRHPGHVAFESLDEFREEMVGGASPVGFGTVLELDTTHGWPDTESVAAWIATHLGRDAGAG